jgi:hypothetical protein
MCATVSGCAQSVKRNSLPIRGIGFRGLGFVDRQADGGRSSGHRRQGIVRHRENGKKTLVHMVSAWTEGNGLVLAQRKVEEKSNELTAIPKLLNALELTGTVVPIDAMGCQRGIARQIIEKKADYVLALKENQGLFPRIAPRRRVWYLFLSRLPDPAVRGGMATRSEQQEVRCGLPVIRPEF